MKIAIIGSGISGLTCAYLLNQNHDIQVLESASRIGGHTATMNITHKGDDYSIDTGFIVYNDWTYPNFIKLMKLLSVESKATEMSFSVSCKKTGLEYGGNSINSLFSQRSNVFNLKYWGMLKDIVRFNKQAVSDLESGLLSNQVTLGEYLKQNNYGEYFVKNYLVPMGSAIWSTTLKDALDFPLLFFIRFFKNHGLLSINNRPQWRVLNGGSQAYLEPLSRSFREKIKTGVNIQSVSRPDNKNATLLFDDGYSESFDHVIFACHSDQALALLNDASSDEQRVLGAIPYSNNEVVLHTDRSLLPQSETAWSSWNYLLRDSSDHPPILSYNMNILQRLEAEGTFIVTLNATDLIDPKHIISKHHYSHPCFTLEGIEAQQQWSMINGVKNTWFCGAYWQNGFHEDGCSSGIRVARELGAKWE